MRPPQEAPRGLLGEPPDSCSTNRAEGGGHEATETKREGTTIIESEVVKIKVTRKQRSKIINYRHLREAPLSSLVLFFNWKQRQSRTATEILLSGGRRHQRSRNERTNKFRRKINNFHLDKNNNNNYTQPMRLFLILSLINLLTSGSGMLLVSCQHYGTEDIGQQPAFYNELPQPLAFMMGSREFGSGEGRPSTNRITPGDYPSSSSSVTPSLITAKCWNNYENDNDCKHINVITASNANEAQQQQNQNQQIDDDSLITPVVIFESSSILPEQPDSDLSSPAFMAPPYFSSSSSSSPRPDGSANIPLARHRTPPTANDVYAAPPAGATHLPPLSNPTKPPATVQQHHYRPPATSWPSRNDDERPTTASAVTRPSTKVYVATPAPKKPPKTTTVGRKCRDENDDDCDEPEEDNEGEDNNNNDDGGGGSDDNEPDGRAGEGGSSRSDKEEDNESDGDSGENNGLDSTASSPYGRGEDKISSVEQGSGGGPDDDNEPSDEDEADAEYSGSSEVPTEPPATRHLEVEPVYPQGADRNRPPGQIITKAPKFAAEDQSPNLMMTTAATRGSAPQTNGAEIEIVVHSTLPPSFPITSLPPPAGNGTGWLGGTSTPSDGYLQTTSTTIMPDDTFTSKPVFPPSSSSPANEQVLSQTDGDQGGAMGMSLSPTGASSVTTTTEMDLATFVNVPIPSVELPKGRHASNEFHNQKESNSSSSSNSQQGDNDKQGENGDNNGEEKLNEKHKFDPSSIATSGPQKFDSPWREKPPLRPSPGGQLSEPWANPRYQRPRPQDQQQQGAETPVGVGGLGNKSTRVQAEVLPTLLIYASIVIIVVTAIIFTLVAFAFWRRNSARQRALLLHKTLNGGPSQHQMVGSLSQGSQLVANIQQPGLLSTYAPGKSLAGMGKVTTSIIRSSDDSPIAEEDEGLVDNSSPKDSLGEGSYNGANEGNNQHRQQDNSSWSRSEDQTTTTSGSQRTNDSQQQMTTTRGQPNMQQQPQPPGANARGVRYSNSLSDERQNSSSISDSQSSPIDNAPPMVPRKPPHVYSPMGNQPQPMGYPLSQVQQSPYHLNRFDNNSQQLAQGDGRQPPQNYPSHHQVTGYYNPQAVIQDSVERYNSNRFMNDPRYMTNEPAPNMQPPYMMGPNQMMVGQQQLMKPPIANCPPPGAQRHNIYPPPSPASSYSSSTLPRQLMNQQGPNEGFPINGMPQHPRLGNGYMHRNTISMEFSNQFDAHV